MTEPLENDFEYLGLDIIRERDGATLHRFNIHDFGPQAIGSFGIIIMDDLGALSMDARIQQAHLELARTFKRWAAKAEGLAMMYEKP